MPTSTAAEQDDLHAFHPDLRTIETRPEESKQGRWFSWNASAHPHLREFIATKMIIEEMLNVPGASFQDPDDARVKFDDLSGACKANSPQRQLSKLRQHGGGFQLCYRLMSYDLHLVCKIIVVATKACWDYYTFLTKRIKNLEKGASACHENGKRMAQCAAFVGNFQTRFLFTRPMGLLRRWSSLRANGPRQDHV